MTLSKKIIYLEKLLNQPQENFADSFKQDIILFFDDDFSEKNANLLFLNNLNTQEEIECWLDKLTSRFVLKFDPDAETEKDFIYDYLNAIFDR